MHARPLVALIGSLIGFAVTSAAAAVTVTFEGTVTSIVDDQSLLDESVQVGSPMSGSFTYPSTGTDLSFEPGVGVYDFAVPPAAFRFEVGAYVFETWPAVSRVSVLVRNDAPQDLFGIGARPWLLVSGPLDPPYRDLLQAFTGLTFTLGSSPPGPLSSDELPGITPLLASWPVRRFRLEAASDTGPAPILVIDGQVTAVVPEPSSLSLLSTVLLLLGVRRWHAEAR